MLDEAIEYLKQLQLQVQVCPPYQGLYMVYGIEVVFAESNYMLCLHPKEYQGIAKAWCSKIAPRRCLGGTEALGGARPPRFPSRHLH